MSGNGLTVTNGVSDVGVKPPAQHHQQQQPATAAHPRLSSATSHTRHGSRRDYKDIHKRGEDRTDSNDCGGGAGGCFLTNHVPLLRALCGFKTDHEAFTAYARSLPFKTVVPEPPHTLREYLAFAVQYIAVKVVWGCVFLLASPFLLLVHLLLMLADRQQRRRWAKFQGDWPYHSVPHVRPVRYKADDEFPLEEWHLRSEDGRQRWYHGAPLLTREEGNELGIAQVYGMQSVTELYEREDQLTGAAHCVTVPNGHDVHGSTGSNNIASSGESSPAASAGPAFPHLPPLGKAEKAALARKLAEREAVEKYQLGLWPGGERTVNGTADVPRKPRATSEDAMRDGLDFLLCLQDPFSGHWPNDYSGCMFLTPGAIFMKFITCHGDLQKMFPPNKTHVHVAPCTGGAGGSGLAKLTGDGAAAGERASSPSSFAGNEAVAHSYIGGCGGQRQENSTEAPAAAAVKTVPCRCGEATRRELIRYLRNYQNADGGWGQHTEGHSTMLGTVLSYVSLRLLGVPKDDPQVASAREWIQAEGGAVSTPMWGKVWLCILGLFSYDGVPPVPPELVLMPEWVPFSEGRAWCHSRVIAIPFSYFYGLRWSAPSHPLLESLKEELYLTPFSAIPWRQYRFEVCRKDLYVPTSRLFRLTCSILDVFERHHPSFLRRYALEQNWKHIAYDDENTHFIGLGPVNKSLNMLVTWIREGEKSTRYKLHNERVDDYFYMGPTGMKMNGYNGSQLWDTSFAVQAVCACRQEMLHPQQMALAHHYVDVAQVQEDPIAMATFYRHRTRGAWNFSTSPQGWQVSDCTAEGLRVILLLHHLPFPTQRVFDAVDEILSLRNAGGDGGWATYESTRGPHYCELMNCAELFKDVMVDYSYAECSSSCIHSLALFREHFPHYRRHDVDTAIREGIACVLGKQRPDGGFYGSWAVCFTYAAWIVADALRVSGEIGDRANHPHCVKLINFLLEHQNSDGGWGEDVNACVRQVWVDNPDGSQVVNTAWALMAIANAAGESRRTSLPRRQRITSAVDRAARFIMSRQLANGDWAQERISGIFNGNSPIHYPGYKNSMTVWALGRYNSWKANYVV